MKASRIATRTLLSAFVFACTAIAIAITLCATLSQAAADETATSSADKPLAMTAADGSLTTVPYPQGKAFVYAGTEKNAVDADLVAVDDGFIFRDGVAEAAMGADHTAACTNTGDLYIWGSNALSQLGIEGIEQSLTPVKLLSGVKKTDVGTWHSAAITDEGDLYLWGDNSLGQIGAGYNTRYKPVKVLSHVKQVSLGHYYSAAVTDNGDLYMWGRGEYGQLGVGQRTTLYAPVKVLSGVAHVECGAEHTAAITTNGDLYMWGSNDHGKLGDGTNESRLTPVKVFSNVAQVSLGYSYTAALTTSGEVYTWGAGSFGSLGDGAHEDRNYPAKVFENVVEISSGDGHTGVITTDGDLYMWGGNLEKQINDSDTERFYYPTEVLSNVAHVSLGPGTTSVIDTSGMLLTWGSNTSGTLGDGTNVTRGTPAEVEGLVTGNSLVRFYEQDSGDAVYATDAGSYHCYAVPYNGCCWQDGTCDPIEVNWAIDKAAYDMSGVTFDDAAFAHDGTAHSIEVTGELPEGVTVSYEGNGQTEPGTYTVIARFAGDTRNHKSIDDMTASLTVNEAPNWMRLGGKTRYDTMAAIVDQTFPETSDYAVLVSGANFPDALSAASLAGMYECPVITTKPDALSSQARAELERLGAKNVFIVGGTGAVSKAVETAVADLNGGVTVTRISGSTRYNTAIEVMKHVAGPRPVFTVFVATGKNFPDALAASPYSYANRAPIVLIDPNKGITSAQVNAIRSVGAMQVVLLGGKSVVPDSVETTLRDSGIYRVLRIAGNTRYTTAIEMAKWAAQNGSDLSAPVVATGLKDADALVGATLAGKNNSVLLLVDEKNDKGKPIDAPAVDFLAEHAAEVSKGYILGGENAVSRAMVERILAATYGVLVDSPASLIGQSVDTAIDMTAQLAADNRQFTAAQIG